MYIGSYVTEWVLPSCIWSIHSNNSSLDFEKSCHALSTSLSCTVGTSRYNYHTPHPAVFWGQGSCVHCTFHSLVIMPTAPFSVIKSNIEPKITGPSSTIDMALSPPISHTFVFFVHFFTVCILHRIYWFIFAVKVGLKRLCT